MSLLGFLILTLVIALPIAWFVSEFQAQRATRLSLGVCAILLSFGVAFLAGSLQRLNYNAWYGGATEELIATTITEIEKGRTEKILTELKRLQQQFRPTYENRAHYDVLVEETVSRMKADDPKEKQ